MRVDNKSYYNEFASWYEKERHHGYHALIDDLQADLIQPWCAGQDVLEVGCGTGLLLQRVAPIARSHLGVDLSPGMLEKARERGLHVREADASALPLEDASFDVVYSFKVLSHVQAIEQALAEFARVTRPGGTLFLEFYNRRSVRYLAKRAASPGRVSERLDESAVYTRWYGLEELTALLPPTLELVNLAGVRVVTPAATVHRVPVLAPLVRRAEFALRDSAAARFGGFLVLQLRRV